MSLLSSSPCRRVLLATPLAAAALLTACSSSGSSGGSSGGATSSGKPAAAPAAGTSVIVQAHTGPLGTYLTDGAGRTLYMWKGDHGNASACAGACAQYWPPLTVKAGGAAKAMGSATQGKVAIIKRSDGTKQVSYGGHPLYYFSLDAASGTTKGQGNDGFGAKWWVVTPAGAADLKAAAQPSHGGSASSGGGSGTGGY